MDDIRYSQALIASRRTARREPWVAGLHAVRPRHWLKNVLVFLPLIASQQLRSLRWPVSCTVLAAIVGCVNAQEPPPDQAAQYEANIPKTILELQQFRHTARLDITHTAGGRAIVTLTEINPHINAWFLLSLSWSPQAYHLENADPIGTKLSLAEPSIHGLRLLTRTGEVICPLWTDQGPSALESAQRSGLPFAPLCGGRVYLRNAVPGTYTHIERVTNFLRDHVWGGDRIVTFVREQFFQDAFAEKSVPASPVLPAPSSPDRLPRPAHLDASSVGAGVEPEHLGINLGISGPGLALGRWYPVNNTTGIYLSAIQPKAIDTGLLGTFRGKVNTLEATEAAALDYLVAFDLAEFDLGFVLGTDHPRVDWSGREADSMHDPALAGPDGIGTSSPLVRNGMLNPDLISRVAATIAAGFKREHGAFRYGELARQNHGSHYGFIEEGAVFSKLQPGLSTVYALNDGSTDLKTWTRDDDALLPRIRSARQNGVPLIEYDPGAGSPLPGALVTQWGAGNWSGSSDEKLRTLRAGLCLQQTPTHRFLLYGYFSTATPSAMVRVFQAYGCRYAMHLDMNALEHTYLALYTRDGGQFVVQHLIEGMAEVDRKGGGQLAPRFLSFPDDRDFFYLVRKQ